MDRSWWIRFAIVVLVALFGWGALWPTLGGDPVTGAGAIVPAPDFVKRIYPGGWEQAPRIARGLDIQGGFRLMYEVEVDQAISDRRDRMADQMLASLGELLGVLERGQRPDREALGRVRERVRVERLGETRIRATFSRPEDAERLTGSWLEERFPELREVDREGGIVTFALREDGLRQLRESAVQEAVRTITNRIDELQIREMTVVGRETDIIIEVPGRGEAERARVEEIVSRTARLEFRIVDDEGSSAFHAGLGELPEGVQRAEERTSAGETRPDVASAYLWARGDEGKRKLEQVVSRAQVPDDHVLLIGRDDEHSTAEETAWRTWYLFSSVEVTGEDIQDAYVSYDSESAGRPVVIVRFGARGADAFGELTGANVKRRMAIVLDNRVESAPVIQERIGGGTCRITLGERDFDTTLREANDLVVVLRAGALPAPIRKLNSQLIGPTLGQDSVQQGVTGALVGVSLVLLFMIVYYEIAGLVAAFMVLLNVMLVLGTLGALGGTLTLPGIAGIALTVGMAVDANVLTTERIREELRLGKVPRVAVEQGFARAFWSILDSQLTTAIAGVVLFQYGTGPIKGFAVTLLIGIAASLFTGVFCSKVAMEWITRGLRVARLRVG
ncbi:MAG: protein translocase subunit SecD [Myxococcota bacterium]|nr:protein translocase subunit SecD [Myxococcota bacterium]MDW8361900.1 protein translocase subunit SecD [Myxococcales bacterium]